MRIQNNLDKWGFFYNPLPTAQLFHACQARVKAIMGPYGSGKSVACCAEIIRHAWSYPPNRAGVRDTRWLVVRNTYPELRSTTIATWQQWVPQQVCPIVYRAPIEGTIHHVLEDKTTVHLTLLFLALDRPDHISKLESLEITAAWVNEGRHIPWVVFDTIKDRTGRWPKKSDGAKLGWTGVITDSNPPDDDHWWYQKFEVEKLDGWELFKQPPALRKVEGRWVENPAAENIKNQNKGYGYWLDMTDGKSMDQIKVRVLGEYASCFDGKPVYRDQWSDQMHVAAEPLQILRGLPLFLGFDFGLTPACVVTQLSPKGQVRVLREYILDDGSLRQLLTILVRPALSNEFTGMRVAHWSDPAGGARSQVDDRSCFDELREFGIQGREAPTNEFLKRRSAVVDMLNKRIGLEPGLIVDPGCVRLIKGFNGGYKFNRVQVPGMEIYRDVPDKNEFSHIHDALQYVCLGLQLGVMQDGARRVAPGRAPLPRKVAFGART